MEFLQDLELPYLNSYATWDFIRINDPTSCLVSLNVCTLSLHHFTSCHELTVFLDSIKTTLQSDAEYHTFLI